jgi:hypothetical protein
MKSQDACQSMPGHPFLCLDLPYANRVTENMGRPFFLVSAQDATGIWPRRLYLGRSNKTPTAKFLLAIALFLSLTGID